ncbi:hypothetical protein [Vacuolonema iberomarrocanum]|uniref:hypothetical protein n=1 Tax=Vacuolonema iberomarrocanum TaxID=3454632 RepID=UPI003F6DEAA1
MTMELAYTVGAIAVRQRLAEQAPAALASLDRIEANEVSVCPGSYDHVERILERLQIPFRLQPNGAKNSPAKLAFVNCSNSYNQKLIQRLRDRVQDGMWLVSSDWALGHFLQQAFPGMVAHKGRVSGDEVVSVEASLDSLWSNVVVLGADPQWWLEGSSHPINILNPDKVTVESASHELLVRYNAPAVAVRFDWGAGHVFHVVSHFWCRRSRTPTARHRGPCTDFLQAGMKLSEAGIATVLEKGGIQPDTLNFAEMQTAATSTELIAQLCIQAISAHRTMPARV